MTLYGPCNWPSDICVSDETDSLTPEELAEIEAEAVFILWSLTGQRFGQCEVTVTPPPRCACGWTYDCVHRSCTLYLPGPVGDIVEVIVNGEVTDDWVKRGDQLLRSTKWPYDTSVTYLRGIEVPAGGLNAVRELATQLALSRCNSGKCALPPNWAERTRRGDRVQKAGTRTGTRTTDEPELLGLPTVDWWIRAVNNLQLVGSVWSPDIDPYVVQQNYPNGSSGSL